jgi:hypothetical protein
MNKIFYIYFSPLTSSRFSFKMLEIQLIFLYKLWGSILINSLVSLLVFSSYAVLQGNIFSKNNALFARKHISNRVLIETNLIKPYIYIYIHIHTYIPTGHDRVQKHKLARHKINENRYRTIQMLSYEWCSM